MKSDIRDTPLYAEAEKLHVRLRQPRTGQISDASEVHSSLNGEHAVFAGTIVDKLESTPPTRICRVDLSSGETQVMSFGPYTDRLPKYSPDGRHIAFLSDRVQQGSFQLYLLDPISGAARATPTVEGWVEYLHWSPDGRRILLGVAGHGADVAGGQGAIRSKEMEAGLSSWMPAVETGDETYRWRAAWIYELAANAVKQVGFPGSNIWEAVWCGNSAIAAIVSPGPGEGLWYTATLELIELASGQTRELYKPRDQLGWPMGSPSGKHLAVVEAICSDRGIVAGDLLLIDTDSGTVQRVDTLGVDVTYTEWRSDRALLVTGHRGFDTVIGMCNLGGGTFKEVWVSRDITVVGRYASASGIGEEGDCVVAGEGFTRAPEIAVIREGDYRTVRSFDLGYAQPAQVIGAVDCVTWKAPDGLEIQGWLLKSRAKGPYPLILNVHGGPVWQFRPTWLGRYGVALLMLLKRGYAIFQPNPRGSTGRGQEFARLVLGDLGGAETMDHLFGLDHLVRERIADPNRLGITGGSHGGFMTSWLIGQDPRFAAAVPLAPVTNFVTQHLIANIPDFVSLFLKDEFNNPGGRYFERSPIMHAHKVRTPTLNICGRLDRCTPPEEAVQFHNALLENGVKSVLLTYPEEGHGVRKFPAAIDYAARVVGWFTEHMPADSRQR